MALRIRVIVYAAVGVPIMLSAELTLVGDVVAIAGLAAAAAVPLLIRSSTSLSGIGVAATTDVLLSWSVWLLVPVAAPITLIITVWAVASMVFLAPQRVAGRFALFAVVMESSKLLLIAFAPDLLGRSTDGLVWSIVGRAAVISATYFVTRALDQYFSRLYVASESASARYRRLMDAAPTALLVLSDGVIVYANEAATQLLDAETHGVDGVALYDLVDESQRSALDEQEKRVLSRFETAHIEGVEMKTVAPS